MRLPRRSLTLFSVVLLSVGVACTSRAVQPKSGASSSERFLNFDSQAEPEYLDPGMMSGQVENYFAMALFEGLAEFDAKDSHPVPGVAERWDISPDGTVYTFYLRKNATWTDGKPVTAHDFVYSWLRLLNPQTASKYAFVLYPVNNAEAYNTSKLTDPSQVGVKAVDDYTLLVTLAHPTPYFPSLTCFHTYRPVPKWVVEQYGAKWTLPDHIVSNGAFMMKSWIPHRMIVVVKNPKYWDAANVKLPGINFHPIEDKSTAVKMYEAGDLDIKVEPPAVLLPSLIGRPDLIKAPYLTTYFYRINVTRPPLNDARVRQALSQAIDRKTLVAEYLHGVKIPTTSLVPSGMGHYMPAPGFDFNPTEAKRLLTEAGFADPQRFPKFSILYNTDESHKLVAEVIQQMWKQYLGITVNLRNEEWKSYLKSQQQLNYDISRTGWIGDYLDPMTFLDLFISHSGQNQTGWKNPRFDGLIADAVSEPVPNKRLELLRQAEALILNESPVIPIYTYLRWTLMRPYVKGYHPNLQDLHPFKWISLEPTGS